MATPNALSREEAERLAYLETAIAKHVQSWIAVSVALSEIRDKRLYRANDETFAAYVQRRWEMTAARAYQLISSARVVENVNTGLTEKQARTLAPLAPDQQTTALAIAGGAAASLADLEAAVDRARPPRRKRKTARPRPITLKGPGWKVVITRRSERVDFSQIVAAITQRLDARDAA